MALLEGPIPTEAYGPQVEHKTDHVEEAKGLLLEQFQGKPKIEGLVEVVVAPAQDIEDAAIQVREAFEPYTAVGRGLDVAGWRVGESRGGRLDPAYRPFIIGRSVANKSDGRAKWIYRLIRALIGDAYTLQATVVPPAGYEITISGGILQFPWDPSIPGDTAAAQIADLLLDATSVGVRFDLIFLAAPLSESFTFASGDTDPGDLFRGFAQGDADYTGVWGTGGTFAGIESRE
jgi:hypothetical protein